MTVFGTLAARLRTVCGRDALDHPILEMGQDDEMVVAAQLNRDVPCTGPRRGQARDVPSRRGNGAIRKVKVKIVR